MLLNFDQEAYLEKERDGLKVQSLTEKALADAKAAGFKNIFFVGVGGSTSSAMEMEPILRGHSAIEFYLENAAEFVTVGNKRFNADSLVITSSASGDTPEIITAIEYAHTKGAKVLAYVENADTPVGKMVDYLVCNPNGGNVFWYAITLKLMADNGEFPEYDRFFAEMQKLPEILLKVKEATEQKAEAFAQKYMDEPIHYFVGAGNTWGWAFCYAMCLLEEMMWMRTKSVHASDFFHGTLEVIERDVPVTVFMGEDEARPLCERVIKFANRISNKVNVLDTKEYELDGISPEFRWLVSPLVLMAASERITRHLEDKKKHPQEIRRYYRRLKY